MNAIKNLARVFIGLGLLSITVAFIVSLILMISAIGTLNYSQTHDIANKSEMITVAVVYIILTVNFFICTGFGVFVGFKAHLSILDERKKTWILVMLFVFLNIPGGIFYSIWRPPFSHEGIENVHWEPTDPYEEYFGVDYKDKRFDIFDKVKILDDDSRTNPKIMKGDIAYVITSDHSDRAWQKRKTKVLFIHKDYSYSIYDFHSFVFEKVGVLQDDFKKDDNQNVVLNRDYKTFLQNTPVHILREYPHKRHCILNKTKVAVVLPSGKTKKAKLFSFYLNKI